MPDSDFLKMITDSKKLSEKKRDFLYAQLIDMSRGKKPQVYFGVGIVDNFVIDEINVSMANREAMRRALIEILRKIPGKKKNLEVLIDGRDNYYFDELGTQPEYIV
jgi:ribonuclease HII